MNIKTFLVLLSLVGPAAAADVVCPFPASGASAQRAFEADSRASEDAVVSEMRKLKLSPLQERYADRGRKSLLTGDFKRAVAAFSQAAEADPANANPETFNLLADRAVAHVMLDEPEAAYRDYSAAIEKMADFIAKREGLSSTVTGKALDLSLEKTLLARYYGERKKLCRTLAKHGRKADGCAD